VSRLSGLLKVTECDIERLGTGLRLPISYLR